MIIMKWVPMIGSVKNIIIYIVGCAPTIRKVVKKSLSLNSTMMVM